jgi:hypothetical protein
MSVTIIKRGPDEAPNPTDPVPAEQAAAPDREPVAEALETPGVEVGGRLRSEDQPGPKDRLIALALPEAEARALLSAAHYAKRVDVRMYPKVQDRNPTLTRAIEKLEKRIVQSTAPGETYSRTKV